MKRPVHSHDGFVKELIKILSLPERTRSFELRVAVDEVVTVKCEYFADCDTTELSKLFLDYELVIKESK